MENRFYYVVHFIHNFCNNSYSLYWYWLIRSLTNCGSFYYAHGHWPHVNVCRVSFLTTIYGVVCVQLANFSIGDWKDIFIAHVIIIIKSEVSTFPIVIIFFRGCVSEMFVTSYSATYCINNSGKTGNLFSLLLCSLWWMQIIGYVLSWRSYSFVCTLHHLIIIIVQTYPKTLNL